jgi:hypothetical protein
MITLNKNLWSKIISFLQAIGEKTCHSRPGYLTSLVTQTTHNDIDVGCTLYIIAPEIKYEYRVMNVEVVSNTTLRVVFFTLMTRQAEHRDVDISKGLDYYQSVIYSFLTNQLLYSSLDFLVNQVELKREHNNSQVRDKIVEGQARVALLKNGEKISVGFLRVEGDYVIYYTGKGLREIWRASNDQEKERAKQLKALSEDKLMAEGYLAKRSLSDFSDIL